MIYSYIVLQSLYCVLFFSMAAFWATVFPFSYKEAKSQIIQSHPNSYTPSFFPVIPGGRLLLILGSCTSKNSLYYNFIVTVPSSFILWIVCVPLLLVAWTILKVTIATDILIIITSFVINYRHG